MSVYIIGNIAIEDRDEYSKYEAGFLAIFAKYRGEILAVSDEPRRVEGDWPYTRAVILRFPDAESAREWYESPEYQRLAEHRWKASTGSIVSLEGFS